MNSTRSHNYNAGGGGVIKLTAIGRVFVSGVTRGWTAPGDTLQGVTPEKFFVAW